MNANNEGKKPVTKFCAGSVTATIWKNQQKNSEGQDFEVYSVVIDRFYKDGEDYRRTSSFAMTDLPKVRLVTEEAYKYLALKENQ